MNEALTAHAFSEPLSSGESDLKFQFRINVENAARVLREFADSIERKEICIQSAMTYQKASIEDFTMSAIVIKFAQKLPTSDEPVALHGDGPFPIALAK